MRELRGVRQARGGSRRPNADRLEDLSGLLRPCSVAHGSLAWAVSSLSYAHASWSLTFVRCRLEPPTAPRPIATTNEAFGRGRPRRAPRARRIGRAPARHAAPRVAPGERRRRRRRGRGRGGGRRAVRGAAALGRGRRRGRRGHRGVQLARVPRAAGARRSNHSTHAKRRAFCQTAAFVRSATTRDGVHSPNSRARAATTRNDISATRRHTPAGHSHHHTRTRR